MSDKTGDVINVVPRELLERLLDSDGIDGVFDAGKNYAAHQELRALLSEQPQASAAQSAPESAEVLGERCIDGGKCHHQCDKRGDGKCFRRECCTHFGDYSGPWKYEDAAQSAPAGEREAFEEFFLRLYPAHSLGKGTTNAGAVVVSSGYADPRANLAYQAFQAGADWRSSRSTPAMVDERDILLSEARMVIDACLDVGDLPMDIEWMAERASKGRRIYVDDRALAAWQRTQSAGVPEGWKSNLWRYGFTNMNFGLMAEGPYVLLEQVEKAIAAAPAQPAARQEPSTDSHDPSLLKLLEHCFALAGDRLSAADEVLIREAIKTARQKHSIQALEAKPAAHDQGEVQRLREPTMAMVQAACAAFRMDISPMLAMHEALRAALAASTGQEV